VAEAIAPARAADERAVRELLWRSGLPESDVSSASLQNFLVLRDSERLVGVVGLEIGAGVALLRSLAVDPAGRRQGAGVLLSASAERLAREREVSDLFLLTTTAAPFFERRGYRMADRAAAPAFIRSTTQFSGLCPSTAAFMTKHL
jgi:amino-acid N-acetyltransferase